MPLCNNVRVASQRTELGVCAVLKSHVPVGLVETHADQVVVNFVYAAEAGVQLLSVIPLLHTKCSTDAA